MSDSTILSLWRHPVKSMQGEELNASARHRARPARRPYPRPARRRGRQGGHCRRTRGKWPNLFAFRAAFAESPARDLPAAGADHPTRRCRPPRRHPDGGHDLALTAWLAARFSPRRAAPQRSRSWRNTGRPWTGPSANARTPSPTSSAAAGDVFRLCRRPSADDRDARPSVASCLPGGPLRGVVLSAQYRDQLAHRSGRLRGGRLGRPDGCAWQGRAPVQFTVRCPRCVMTTLARRTCRPTSASCGRRRSTTRRTSASTPASCKAARFVRATRSVILMTTSNLQAGDRPHDLPARLLRRLRHPGRQGGRRRPQSDGRPGSTRTTGGRSAANAPSPTTAPGATRPRAARAPQAGRAEGSGRVHAHLLGRGAGRDRGPPEDSWRPRAGRASCRPTTRGPSRRSPTASRCAFSTDRRDRGRSGYGLQQGRTCRPCS